MRPDPRTGPYDSLYSPDNYDIPGLKSPVFTKLMAYGRSWGESPSFNMIIYAYENILPGSSIRKLLADWCAVFDED